MPDYSLPGGNKVSRPDPGGQGTTTTTTVDGGYGSGYGYGGGYGYSSSYGPWSDTGYSSGGSSGDEGPTENQKKTAANLQPIVHYNYDTLGKKYDLGDKVYNTADDNSKNMQDWQVALAGRNASGDWYRQQQKLQSAMKNMRDEMGQAAYGSDFYDMYEGFARADDQMDDDTLQTFRKNIEEIDANFYDAIMANINSRNKLAADTEISMRELGADWAAQLNNIHPDLANGEYEEDEDTEKSSTSAYSLPVLTTEAKTARDKAIQDAELDVLKTSAIWGNESAKEALKALSVKTDTSEESEESEEESEEKTYSIPALIDKENDTLTFPEWFNTEFADEHWVEAIKPEMRDFYRPDLAGQTASDSGLRNRATNVASAATRKTKGIASYLQPYSANSMNRRTQ